MWDIAQWSNANTAVELLYRWGGRLAFTRVGALLVAALCVAGVAAWVRELGAARHNLITLEGSYTAGILSLIALQVLSISVHEAGHALAICHYGRRVRRLGLAMYYLFPCMYVDSTDMAMTGRRARVVVALAGPIGGLTVGALCAIVAASNAGVVGDLAFKAASLFVFQFALNLLPILELDGYHILVDLLDAPLLRQRAIAFARASALTKLRKRQRWTPTELGLATYGVLAIVTSLGMLVFAIALWQSRVSLAASELFATGPLGALAVLVLVVVFIGPLVVALAGRIVAWIR
ncbi:MAG: M50 family metallopeptidase, partial [Chloroflexota bacterium]